MPYFTPVCHKIRKERTQEVCDMMTHLQQPHQKGPVWSLSQRHAHWEGGKGWAFNLPGTQTKSSTWLPKDFQKVSEHFRNFGQQCTNFLKFTRHLTFSEKRKRQIATQLNLSLGPMLNAFNQSTLPLPVLPGLLGARFISNLGKSRMLY